MKPCDIFSGKIGALPVGKMRRKSKMKGREPKRIANSEVNCTDIAWNFGRLGLQ